jgi:15-cis-phytoene synthase
VKPGSATEATPPASARAQEITRASKSNLALAFFSLGKEQRRDITVFYAFCRLIDDIADATDLAPEEKARRLSRWREALTGPVPEESPVAPELRRLIEKYPITPAMLGEIIDGVEMDLTIARYETFAALREYCYRVASAVGLVSIEIFGYRNPVSREYAVELGLALQITNILRDVAKDLAAGRIYLPREDMARFDYAEADLQAQVYDERFVRLMQFEADRARRHFAKAAALLPREDRRAMRSAQIMSSIYRALLEQMERDRFRVFARSYGLSKFAKFCRVSRHLLLGS